MLLDYWSVWLGGAYASDDGDHPNAAGHQQIAKATADVISSALHLG